MKTAHALGIMVSLLTALSVALYLLAQCRNKTPGYPRPLIVCSDWRPPALISSPHSQAGARPNLIYLSYRSAETVPGYIWDQFRTYAPHYDIQFYDDERCLRSLRPFGESVLRCYQSLTEPAHRCDLWRYCMLYQTGGVYLDIKTILTRPVSEMFPHPNCLYTVLSIMPETIYQGIIAVPPKHPIIADAISNFLNDPPQGKDDYLHATSQLHSLIERYTGMSPQCGWNHGPAAGDIYLFQEKKTRHCAQRDRYNNCELHACDASGERMCIVRDPYFPYTMCQQLPVLTWISLHDAGTQR